MERSGRTAALLLPGLIVIVVTVVMSIVVSRAQGAQIGLGVVGTGLVCLVWIVMVSPGGLLARERRATAALAESEHRYRTLVQTAQDLIWSVDASGDWTFVNEAARTIYGIDPEQLINTSFMERAEDGKGQEDAQMLIRAMRGEPCIGQVRRHRRADGTLVDLSFNAAALRDARGNVVGATGTASDITERIRTEQELERSEAQLRLVTDALPVLISYVDADRVVRFANRQHAEWLGRPVAEIVGKPLADVLSEDALADVADHVDAALRGERIQFDREAPHPSLGLRRLRVELEPHAVSQPWSEPRVVGFVALVTDETSRLRLESELRHAQMMEAVGQLASGVAHDFNNLLSAMFSQIAVARHRLDHGQGAREVVDELELTAQQARGVARFLLSLGRKGTAQRSVLDLAALIRQTGQMLTRVLPASIAVRVDAPETSPVWVSGDSVQLQQTLLNLAINARDAMPKGGTLEIRVAVDHAPCATDEADGTDPNPAPVPCAAVTVTDTGHGMTPDILARIFEPFFTTKPMGRGTGLGLAIIRGIIEDHRGTIEASSIPGRGTTFVFRIPMCDAPEAIPPDDREAGTPAHRYTVALAAANQHVREILAASLAAEGFAVVQCTSAEETTSRVLSPTSDVQGVVIDLGGVLGPRCLAELRRAGCDAAAVLITDAPQGENDPRTRVLRKPFAVRNVPQALRGILDHAAENGDPS